MLKIINTILLIILFAITICLISKRYQIRLDNMYFSKLQLDKDKLNIEYTKLQLEEGTYSSNLLLQNFATTKLNLIEAKNVVKLKPNE